MRKMQSLKMLRRLMLLGISAAICAGAAILTASAVRKKRAAVTEIPHAEAAVLPKKTIPPLAEFPEQIPPTREMPEAPYLLKLSSQTLSVYALGSEVPFETYAVSAGWFPEYDRIVLEHGVQVDSVTELRKLLEDYIS